MKYRIQVWALVVMLPMLLSGCSVSGHDHHDGHNHEEESAAEHNHELVNGHHHEDEIVLSPESAERFGVTTDTVKPESFSEMIKVTGIVELNPSNLITASAKSAGIVSFASGVVPGMKVNAGQTIATISAEDVSGGDQNAISNAELEAASRELERIRPLYEAGVVARKDLNAAQAAYDRARSASSGRKRGSVVTASRQGVVTRLMTTQGGFVNPGDVVATISSGDDMTLRADVPQKHSPIVARLIDANFKPVSTDTVYSLAEFDGRRVNSPAVASASMPGYIPVYFSLNGKGRLVAGSYVEVYLKGAVRENVIAVPQESVTEEQGQYFVFVKIDDHGYEKRSVTLGKSDGKKVEITSGLNDGDEVVSHGAIFVKLAQSAGAIPSGHSHNH